MSLDISRDNVAARLKQRVSFETPLYTRDALGGQTTQWEEAFEAWAEVTQIRGNERESHERLVAKKAYRVYVRKYHAVRADMRLIFEDEALRIRAIIKNPQQEALIEIVAESEEV